MPQHTPQVSLAFAMPGPSHNSGRQAQQPPTPTLKSHTPTHGQRHATIILQSAHTLQLNPRQPPHPRNSSALPHLHSRNAAHNPTHHTPADCTKCV
jgi:hypothetical protein